MKKRSKTSPYTYENSSGQICDLSALLDGHSAEYVAHMAAQESRKHALRRAIEAFRKAGEEELCYEELGRMGIAAKICWKEETK